jgi:hypothetical protein
MAQKGQKDKQRFTNDYMAISNFAYTCISGSSVKFFFQTIYIPEHLSSSLL